MLDFEAATGQVRLAGALQGVSLPATAERIAQLDGVHVLYIDLNTVDNDRVRKAEVEAAAKSIRDVLGDDMLLVVINKSGTQLHIIQPDFSGARLVLRRMVVGRDVPRRTVVQQISNIYSKYEKSRNLRKVLSDAFNVEPVTREFFTKYKDIFKDALEKITGFGGDDDDAKRLFVQTLFNRLMFVHFLSRKGWLTINDDKDYLRALWIDYRNTPAPSPTGIAPNFYRDRLRLLFFTGLNNPDSRDLSRGASPLIGSVPFLNGGLFTEGEHDAEDSPIVVPDSVIEGALAELFEKFNFTVMESTPFDIEVAVDPEMLGKVFEELVNERHDSGAYYTPRPVVAFMCREALKGYLEGKDTGVSADAIAGYIENRDTGGISVDAARRIGAALDEITVVDPACGSGAFLLGMMQELVDLQTTLYNAGVDSRSLHALKLHIIERNLYGVDIDEFAVNIAMLRLWLSLAIDFDGDTPPALPNLDFKIVRGDSLLGPDPSPDKYPDLFRYQAVQAAERIATLKAEFMKRTANTKTQVKEEVEQEEDALRDALIDTAAPDGAVDWRVQFAEVFSLRGGFDVAIANPPYLFGEAMPSRAGLHQYVLARGQYDAYWLFHERSLNSLLSPNGVHCFINSDALLARDESRIVRDFLLASLKSLVLSHVGMVFQRAGVSAVVLVGVRGEQQAPHYTVVDYSGGDFHGRQNISLGEVQRDPNLRFATSRQTRELIGASRLADHCLISRGEELGKKHLSRSTDSHIPADRIGVVSGSGVSRYRKPVVTHLVKPDQVRKPQENYSSPKILVVKTGREFKAAVDYSGAITLQSVYNVRPKDDVPLEAVCAVLNSTRANEWLRTRVTDQKKLFPQITQGNVMEVPIPNFSQEQLVELTELVRLSQSVSEEESHEIGTRIDEIVTLAYGSGMSPRQDHI